MAESPSMSDTLQMKVMWVVVGFGIANIIGKNTWHANLAASYR